VSNLSQAAPGRSTFRPRCRPGRGRLRRLHGSSPSLPARCGGRVRQPRPRGGLRRPALPCAQHGRDLGGESPPASWPQRAKRSATARGRPSVGRKRGANPRANGQEPDTRHGQAGRAGGNLRSSRGQSEAVYMRWLCGEGLRSYLGRPRLMPERTTAAMLERGVSSGRISRGTCEGPNEKESRKVMTLGTTEHRKLGPSSRIMAGGGESS
jgi:hypothetical protein